MLDYCHIISLHRGVVVKLHVVLLVMVDTLYADCIFLYQNQLRTQNCLGRQSYIVSDLSHPEGGLNQKNQQKLTCSSDVIHFPGEG